jgi:hypothetical protein
MAGGDMELRELVEFVGVEVLDEDDLVLLCRVGRRRHWFGVDRLQPGTTVAHRGDRGLLVLDRQFARERGLIKEHV